MIRDLTRLIAVATMGAALIQAASRPPIEVRIGAIVNGPTLTVRV